MVGWGQELARIVVDVPVRSICTDVVVVATMRQALAIFTREIQQACSPERSRSHLRLKPLQCG